MLAGEPFLAGDPDLIAHAMRTRAAMKNFNDAEYDDPHRMQYLCDVLGNDPKELWVESPFFVGYPDALTLGPTRVRCRHASAFTFAHRVKRHKHPAQTAS